MRNFRNEYEVACHEFFGTLYFQFIPSPFNVQCQNKNKRTNERTMEKQRENKKEKKTKTRH